MLLKNSPLLSFYLFFYLSSFITFLVPAFFLPKVTLVHFLFPRLLVFAAEQKILDQFFSIFIHTCCFTTRVSIAGVPFESQAFQKPISGQWYLSFTGLCFQACKNRHIFKIICSHKCCLFQHYYAFLLKNLVFKSRNKHQHIEFDNTWGFN